MRDALVDRSEVAAQFEQRSETPMMDSGTVASKGSAAL